jgi:hypothetical protein
MVVRFLGGLLSAYFFTQKLLQQLGHNSSSGFLSHYLRRGECKRFFEAEFDALRFILVLAEVADLNSFGFRVK